MNQILRSSICLLALSATMLSAPIADAQATNPAQSATQTTLATVTNVEIRAILATLKSDAGELKIIEEKDADGLTAFYAVVGERLLFSLYQYAQEDGKVTSLGLTYGFALGRAVDPRVVNGWNSRQRFTKAFWDEIGDPMLSADINVSSGVTSGAVTDWVKMFMQATKDYEKHIRGL